MLNGAMSVGKKNTMASYEHGLEFDAYQEGIKAEQERIIKLLEANSALFDVDDALEIIKGEQK